MNRKADRWLPTLAALFFTYSSYAIPIDIGGFSGSETVETFSGQTIGRSTSITINDITYTDPLWDVSWLDVIDASSLNLFQNVPQSSGGNTLHDNNTYGTGQQLVIDLSQKSVNRVGGFLSGKAGQSSTMSWNVSVFDTDEQLIETATVAQPNWAESAFFGFESDLVIGRIDIQGTADNGGAGVGYKTFFDDLRYEYVALGGGGGSDDGGSSGLPTNVTRFVFSADCDDCIGGLGDNLFQAVTGELILKDFVAGQALSLENFVSFSYDGSQLLDPFEVVQSDLSFLLGTISADGSVLDTLNFGLFELLNTSCGLECSFLLASDGSWGIGGMDVGINGNLTARVSEPPVLALLLFGLIGFTARRLLDQGSESVFRLDSVSAGNRGHGQ